jgi:hypothetical protein
MITYPVCAELNYIGGAIFLSAKIGLRGTAANSVIVFYDDKVGDGVV